ncbi:EndoU domain-containing protein [Glycomyces luteolus]|uniref:EndoU domain-containing protein n=1 Tax=Glycomyces luteolus TaxID=2670330 RepID=A0A9X3SPT1_9ACTN|nr:EndoU domain-containing protein [Glycomyces luteolus]MDA1359291.1 EndoU domain-containing protein [Glycomyces luteolus]
MRALAKLLLVAAIALALATPKPGPKPGPRPGPPRVKPPVSGVSSAAKAAWDEFDQGQAGGSTPTTPNQPGTSGWTPEQLKDMPNLGDTSKRRTHILYGEYGTGGDLISGGHAPGSGGGTEFPDKWSENQMIEGIENVARNPTSMTPRKNGGYEAVGVHNGVEIKVILNADGTVWTGYPTPTPGNISQGVVVNDKTLLF